MARGPLAAPSALPARIPWMVWRVMAVPPEPTVVQGQRAAPRAPREPTLHWAPAWPVSPARVAPPAIRLPGCALLAIWWMAPPVPKTPIASRESAVATRPQGSPPVSVAIAPAGHRERTARRGWALSIVARATARCTYRRKGPIRSAPEGDLRQESAAARQWIGAAEVARHHARDVADSQSRAWFPTLGGLVRSLLNAAGGMAIRCGQLPSCIITVGISGSDELDRRCWHVDSRGIFAWTTNASIAS